MRESETKQDEVWPPAPNRTDIASPPALRATAASRAMGFCVGLIIYLFCLFGSVLCWIISSTALLVVGHAVFPFIKPVPLDYGSDAIDALFSLAVAVILIRRKSRFGKPLLISMFLTIAAAFYFAYSTQDYWQ